MKQQRLELTWIGKGEQPRLEPRILIEDRTKGHRAATRREGEVFSNLLIQGDNLLALRALEADYSGLVQCVYIDPPFNTKQALPYYDDGIEHSLWLNLMRDRLRLIRNLMSDSGTLFVHIDDNEFAYLVVLLDEIFGRTNRVNVITFKQGAATGHKAINPGVVTTSNFIIVVAKDRSVWSPNRVFTVRADRDKRYGQYIVNRNDEFPSWKFIKLSTAFAQELGIAEKEVKKKLGDDYESELSNFVFENASAVTRLARPDYDSVSSEARRYIDSSKAEIGKVMRLERTNDPDMYFFNGERILFYADKMRNIDGKMVSGEPLTTIWDDLLSNNIHNEGGVDFPKGKKPEALIKRCIELASAKGDIVLDSFAGSGTTGAVAHKMGRRWIMVEQGAHANTHVIPRLTKVIDGNDLSGVTEATRWQGGGGFRFFHLAPSLLHQDRFGQWVVSPEYQPEMLAEAVCKLMGFTYAPSRDELTYWRHGHSTETDFIFVTTRAMTYDALAKLSDEVGEGRTLLVACRAFNARADAFPNLTMKKIPQAVLTQCEWGRDDYSLTMSNAQSPEADSGDDEIEPAEVESVPVKARRGRPRVVKAASPSLFDEEA